MTKHTHDIRDTYRRGFIVYTNSGAYLTVRETIDGHCYEEIYGPFKGRRVMKKTRAYAEEQNITLVRAPWWAAFKQRWRHR